MREHRLAVAHFLQRILLAAFGDFQSGVGRFQLRLGGEAALHESRDALTLTARFVQRSARLSNQRGLIGIDHVGIAVWIEAKPRPRLLQRGIGGAEPQIEVSRRQLGDDVALAHGRSQIDVEGFDPAGHLEAQGHLFFGGERAGHRHAARQWFALKVQDLDGGSRRRRGITSGRRRRIAACGKRKRRGCQRKQENGRTHNGTCSLVTAVTTSISNQS